MFNNFSINCFNKYFVTIGKVNAVSRVYNKNIMGYVVLLRIIKQKIRLIFTCELKFRKKEKKKNKTKIKKYHEFKERDRDIAKIDQTIAEDYVNVRSVWLSVSVIDQCDSDSVDFPLENEWKTGKYYRNNNISRDIIEKNPVLTNCERNTVSNESKLIYWAKIKRINKNNFTETTEYE